jgi:hypothetical protein
LGWCYVEGDNAVSATGGYCDNAILFSQRSVIRGGTAYLQCIEENEP